MSGQTKTMGGTHSSVLTVTMEMWPAEMTDGAKGYMAHDPARRGCVGYGSTTEEATGSLERARAAYDAARSPRERS